MEVFSVMIPLNNTLSKDYLIFTTNVLRNDKSKTDSFEFYKKYEPLAYVDRHYYSNPTHFDERNPAFKFVCAAREIEAKFNPKTYFDRARISSGEVMLILHDNDCIDVYYFDKSKQSLGRTCWVLENFDDLMYDNNLEPNEVEYIKNKLFNFWDAYFESDNPYIPYLQKQYLTDF